MDGQLLGIRTDPVRATLGPKRARHAWRARCATCSTCAKCTACSSRARRAMCGARAACAKCARARDSTHRDTCRPPPSLSKTNAQSRRGGHHGVWWACTHQAICQHPRRPFQKPLDRDHGVAARDPDLAAKCILYCFSAGMVAVHTAGNMLAPPPSLSKNNTKCSRGSRA